MKRLSTVIKSKLMQVYYRYTGQSLQIKKTGKYIKKWYGTSYGGFYVCPEKISDKSIVYSFGVGEDISFDLEIIKKHGCKVFGFDPTPKSIAWLRRQELPHNFHFREYGINKKSGMVDFHLPKNENNVSGSLVNHNFVDSNNTVSVRMKSLKDIMFEFNHDKIDVLKMDIEGAEYDIIEDIIKLKVNIEQLLIEFHNRMIENGLEKTQKILRALDSAGYKLFAISETHEELSFIKEQP